MDRRPGKLRSPIITAVVAVTAPAKLNGAIGWLGTEVIRRRWPVALWNRRVRRLESVDWFNTRRLLEPLGSLPPAEYEARYYDEQAAVA
jgi:transposase InsO family protein